MTEHLRPEDFVEALEDAAGASTDAHLAACAECREELAGLRAVMRETTAVDAPAPSPLFWDHFSDHVREATGALPVREPWWSGVWRPAAVFAVAAGALAVIIAVQPRPTGLNPVALAENPTGTVAVAEVPDDGSWSLVVGLASGFKLSDVKAVAEPVAGTADAMIDELTPAQRATLARLLEKEMGDQ